MSHSVSDGRFGEIQIIGQSPQTRVVLDFIHKAAATDSNVLLEGESGVGKELIAKAIHLASARASGPYVAVNCGALNPGTIESELFGHEKGAFTGAVSLRIGLFERADRGTLFLDEIGEMPLQDQVKLLRAVQERRIERIGGTKEIKVNVRIIAATNRILLDEVDDGNFRRDLYFRLAVLTLHVFPLRERVEDILPLTRHFLRLHCGHMNISVPALTPEAETVLLQYPWPGNIRELENVIERTLALGAAEEISAGALAIEKRQTPPDRNRSLRSQLTLRTAASAYCSPSLEPDEGILPLGVQFNDLSAREKREAIDKALQRSPRDLEKAAGLLGLSSRSQLYRFRIKLGMISKVEK